MSSSTSPFPPIADYAFLSNCHTGALVAPDGSVDWLCLPAFDASSAFGTLLDRGAGSFRFGPYGINVPNARSYVPGTNVITTTWHTPSGWAVIHDALTMGPRRGADTVTPHTRPPADDDADHLLVRVAECIEGSVEMELVCEPAFDYGRVPAQWQAVGEDDHAVDATGSGQGFRLSSDMHIGIEGDSTRARHTLTRGQKAFCAMSWAEGLVAPVDVEEAEARIAATVKFWRSLAGACSRSRPPAAPSDRALGADDQRTDLHADRGHDRRPHDVVAGDAGRRTELGLSLHVDARHHFHLAGSALPEPGRGGGRVHAVRRRPGAELRRCVADHVRHRRAPRPDRVDPRRPHRLRRCAARPDRQRRIRPEAERRVRCRARLRAAAHQPKPAPPRASVAPGPVAGRGGDGRLA